MTGETVSDELAAKVYEETDGNPLFAGEIGRLIASEGGAERPDRLPVPEGVREAIGRRVERTSGAVRQALEFASVLGREFDVDALEQISGLDQEELFAALEEAMSARLVAELPDRHGRFRFAHMLIRDAVYEELPATRRLRLHLEIGGALEALYADNLEPHLAELAHHYLLAGVPGAEPAIRFATAAGDRAASQLAYEEAARHYGPRWTCSSPAARVIERRSCELLLSLGDVLHRAGNGSEAKAALRRAADIADENGWAELLARAALGYSGRFTWARASTDPALVPLLERALSAVGDDDGQARARLLGRLAVAARDDEHRERRVLLGKQAVETAERTGDPATLAYALESYLVACSASDSMRRAARSVSSSASTSGSGSSPNAAMQPCDVGATGRRRRRQQLAEVVEVGERSVAVGSCEDPGHHAALGPHPPHELDRAVVDQRRDPPVEPFGEVGERGVGGEVHLLGAPTDEPRQGEGPHPPGVGRPQHGVEQPPPLQRGRSLEDRAAAGEHRRDAVLDQHPLDRVGLLAHLHQHGDVVGLHRTLAAVPVGDQCSLEQIDDLHREVGVDVAGDEVGDDGGALLVARDVGSGREPQRHRRQPA